MLDAVLGPVPAIAAAFALVAAVVHVYIFVLESMLWTTPRARATFATTPDAAVTTRELAYNQGWYNLFLAVGTVLGLALSRSGDVTVRAAGVGVLLLATASMVGAALVLVQRTPKLARAAAVQGFAPLVAIVLIVVLSG